MWLPISPRKTADQSPRITAPVPKPGTNWLIPNSRRKENGALTKYRAALFDKFTGLLKEPVTPVVAPPKTMRVLLLPYTGQDNEFYMLRYVYFFVDEPRWLLGDTVTSGEEE